MVIIEINLANPQEIDFSPKNEALEVAQNIYTLLVTEKYTVPLNREFGLSATMIDQSINLVQAQIRAEILEAITKYEPRFTVTEIDFSKSKNLKEGVLYPIVKGGLKK